MKRKSHNLLCIYLVFICLSNHVFAFQNGVQRKIDSLQKIIKTATADTSKALAYAELGYQYLNSTPAIGIELVKKGLALANAADFAEGQAKCYNNLGGLYDTQGDYQNALNAQIQSKVIHEKLKDKLGIALNDANIANIYAHYGNLFAKSVREEFRIKAILEQMPGQEAKVIGLLNNIGDGYEHLGKTDSALLAIRDAQKRASKIKNDDYTGIAFNNLGNIYLRKYKDDTTARAYRDSAGLNFQEALRYYKEDKDLDGICETTLGLANLYKVRRMQDSSQYFAWLSYSTAFPGSFRLRMLDAAKLLSGIYKSQGDLPKTVKYLELADSLNTLLYHQDKVTSISLLFEGEQKREEAVQKEIERQHKADRNNLQMIIISFVILVFGLTIFFYSKKKANPHVIRLMVFLGLLMVFEFISLLLHPHIERITQMTDEVPIVTLLVLMAEAAILGPAHERIEKWVMKKLVHQN